MNSIHHSYFLLSIPRELLSLILNLLNMSSIFSLCVSGKKYRESKVIGSHIDINISVVHLHLDTISNKHVGMFRWFVPQNKITQVSHEIYTNVSIRKGCLDILKYLHKHGCPLTKSHIEIAVETGDLEIVKYLYKNSSKFHLDKTILLNFFSVYNLLCS